MNRTSRGGKTQPKQTGHSNILGNSTGIGAGLGATSGGQFSPAGIASGPNEDGSAGVTVPASVSPVQVNHPILDTIFNRGQGTQFANQANLGIAMQQLQGQQGLDLEKLTGSNKLANTTLEGQNTLANTKQTGQNALEALIEGAKQGRLTQQQVHDYAQLAKYNLTSEALPEVNGTLNSKNLENASTQITGEQKLGRIKNNYLDTPTGIKAAEGGFDSELQQPTYNAMGKTKMILDPGQFGYMAGRPLGLGTTGYGGSAGGIKKVSNQQRDPNNPLSLTTTDTETRVPGTRGFMQPPNVVDSEEDKRKFLESQKPNFNPSLGISPVDPSIPTTSGIQQQPTVGFGMQPLQINGLNNMTPNTGIMQPKGSFVNPNASNSIVPNPNELSIMQKLQMLQQQGWPFNQ